MSADLASEDYLKDKAKLCPHCNAPIEKNEGCNKVGMEGSSHLHHLSPGHETTCHRSPQRPPVT